MTAESMAQKQRDISVSEFFAKNRHLLGFDNPRKALLTTVKEAVDNSLDACEEAGIVPEIWVHIEPTEPNRFKVGVQDNGPGIVKKQIPLIFGKLLYGSKFHRLRMSRGQQGIGISAAGMYGMLTTGKPVKIISKISLRKPAHYYEIQIDTKKNRPGDPQRQGRGRRHSAGRGGPPVHRRSTASSGSSHYDAEEEGAAPQEVQQRHAGDDRAGGQVPARPRQRRRVPASRRPSPIRTSRSTTSIPKDNAQTYRRSTDELPPEPKEIKPHPYGVELGRLVTMLKDTQDGDDLAVPDRVVLAGQPGGGPADLRGGQAEHAGVDHARSAATRPTRSTRRSRRRRSRPRRPTASRRSARSCCSRGCTRWCRASSTAAATRPAGRLSRQSVPDRSRPGLRRRQRRPEGLAGSCSSELLERERRPHAAPVPDQHVRRPGRRRGRQDPQGGRSSARASRPAS